MFYPSDAVSTERAVELAANTKGICFIRTSRPATEVIYENNEVFEIGKAKVVRASQGDKVLLIGAGVTLYECLKAAKELGNNGISVRVLDPFTIKPLDEKAIIDHASKCGGRIVVVEDHYKEGGVGEAVLSAVARERNVIVKHLYVPNVPRSGPPNVLLNMFGISAPHILNATNDILKL